MKLSRMQVFKAFESLKAMANRSRTMENGTSSNLTLPRDETDWIDDSHHA